MTRIALIGGRFNPPTRGHYVGIKVLAELARSLGIRAEVFVIDGEQSGKDKQKNPLTAEQRIKILKRWIPEVHFDIASSAYDIMEVLEVQNKKPEIWVAGSDRAKNYSKLLNYSGFNGSRVVELDRDAGEAEGVSATKVREAVAAGDFDTFSSLMPYHLKLDELREIYALVGKALTRDGSG